MMVDPATFARNIGLLIGLLLLSGVTFILFVSAWTMISSLIWIRQRRRAEQEHRAKEFRPDGQPFPPIAEGTCNQCGRGSRRIYFPLGSGGKELCPTCYDAYWRETEAWQVVSPQPSRAQPSRAQPSRAQPSRAQPSRARQEAAPLHDHPNRTHQPA